MRSLRKKPGHNRLSDEFRALEDLQDPYSNPRGENKGQDDASVSVLEPIQEPLCCFSEKPDCRRIDVPFRPLFEVPPLDLQISTFRPSSKSTVKCSPFGLDYASLDKLPVELKIAILEAIPDLPTLRSLTLASPGYYFAYVGQRRLVLSKVLANGLAPEILVEACSLLEASHIKQGRRWYRDIRKFTNSYEVDRALCVTPEIQHVEILRQLAGSYLMVHDMAVKHVKAGLSMRPVAEETLINKEINLLPLSSTELQRFHRAFYHYEILCRLFGGRDSSLEKPSRRTEADYSHAANSLLASFNLWEIEEINCVHHFIRGFYVEVVRRCSSEMQIKFGSTDSPGGRVIIAAPYDRYIYKYESVWYREAAERCTGMGLTFLRKVMNATSQKAEAALLVQHIFSPDISGAFMHTIWLKSNFLASGLGAVSTPRGFVWRKLEFLNDDEGPNAALVWACSLTLSDRRYWPNKEWLLSWAYVMWDHDRLHNWGILKGGYRYIAKMLGAERDKVIPTLRE